ncbi:MAG TPA: permease, partial [Chloroflexota bacterium]|nr:permease [Chloroflexota bacterium]
DLIILPILDIYRKYYGGRTSLYLLLVSYAAMALAGFLIALLFSLLGLTPPHTAVAVLEAHPAWNLTTLLDGLALLLVAILAWRFLSTGGPAMLRMMRRPATPESHTAMDRAHHHM